MFDFKPQSAFSLIEMLVVVVLVGLLVAIAAPDYLKFRQKVNLQNSLDTLKAGFGEAFSLARSQSKHYLITGGNGLSTFTLSTCDDPACLNPVPVKDSFANPDIRELAGATVVSSPRFEIQFLAPHGDMNPITPIPVGAAPITLTLENRGLSADLQLHPLSGLVTTETP